MTPLFIIFLTLLSSSSQKGKAKIKTITSAVVDGVTKYYITDVEGNKYKASIKVNEDKLPFATKGTKLNISYKKGEGVIEIIKVN